MSMFMYLVSFLTHKVMKTPLILGNMLTAETTPEGELSQSSKAQTVGMLAHYAVGAAMATGFLALWDSGVGAPTWPWAILFGIGAGVLGIFVWRLFFLAHPRPPQVPLFSYFHTLLLGHIVFALATFYAYRFLAEYVFNLHSDYRLF